MTQAGRVAGEPADRTLQLEDITASASEVVSLFALAHALSTEAKIAAVGTITFAHMRRMIPHSFAILFVYVERADQLVAAQASGEAASLLTGMTVAVGQRLSGWVAASRQTIRNSDPALDLGEVAKTISPRPRSCLSTPLATGSKLVGVLTLYSANYESFSKENERLIEAVARQLAPAIGRALEQEDDGSTSARRPINSQEGQVEVLDLLPNNTCLALIELSGSKRSYESGRMQAFVSSIAEYLQPEDLVFRNGVNRLAILCKAGNIPALQVAVSKPFWGLPRRGTWRAWRRRPNPCRE
jgi:putative methionine-R-sulfoxide reductase with GAF domain